jgi:hypothetical protein
VEQKSGLRLNAITGEGKQGFRVDVGSRGSLGRSPRSLTNTLGTVDGLKVMSGG